MLPLRCFQPYFHASYWCQLINVPDITADRAATRESLLSLELGASASDGTTHLGAEGQRQRRWWIGRSFLMGVVRVLSIIRN